MKRIACILLAAALAAASVHAHEASGVEARALGQIDFPTSSRSAPAQAAFIEGMLLLHLFEYTSAADAFQRAQQLEPGFAMAYWGEAMTHTHPVWNQQDVAAGRAALAKLAPTPAARAAKAGSERERDFLALTEILYGDGSKPERDLRALAHLEAMAKRYPDDDEVQSFLALSLLGADQGVRNLPRYLRAAEISRSVFKRNPRHAGAAHYWIHGMDDPVNASGALEAARALAKIAPGAGHSQHMTSHIFVALGMWDEVVESNLAARRVVNEELAAKGRPPYSCGHYTEWLQYAYFQQGRDKEAIALLEACATEGAAALAWLRAHPGEGFLSANGADDLQVRLEWSLMMMRATALVEAPALRVRATAVSVPLGRQGAEAGWAHFASGLTHARHGELDSARADLAAVRKHAGEPAGTAAGSRIGVYLSIMAAMLEGAIAEREGRVDEGIRLVRSAAEKFEKLPFDFGPPATIKPPRELLGEMLAAAGRPGQARAEFERALKSAPGRRLALRGRAGVAD